MARKAKPKRILFGPEAEMRDTIEWLLELPHSERERMEVAENHTFSMSEPAPPLESGAGGTADSGGAQTVTLPAGSVEATVLLTRRGFRPAVLNFAHGYNCGGGFEHAGGSQEEDIFRKTSAFLSLWPHRRSDDGPGVLKRGMWIGDFDEDLPRKEPFYPHADCGGIYSPHVRAVRRLGEGGQHPLLDVESCLSSPAFAVLTLAAQNVCWDPPFNRNLLVQKARTVLWMAASRGHDSVVLGAFGCGYFANPPDVVAETFRMLLKPGGEFAGAFRLAVFAVIGGNRRPFAERFPLVKERDLPITQSAEGRSGAHVTGSAAAIAEPPAHETPADEGGPGGSGTGLGAATAAPAAGEAEEGGENVVSSKKKKQQGGATPAPAPA